MLSAVSSIGLKKAAALVSQYPNWVSPFQTVDESPNAPPGAIDSRQGPAGRVVGLAIHTFTDGPSTLYAASSRDGVWRSIDGGDHWQHASHGMTFGITAGQQYNGVAARPIAVDYIGGAAPARIPR
jgi:hypothetical protein